jgi:thiol-disulfide isomerase/thioredoxin
MSFTNIKSFFKNRENVLIFVLFSIICLLLLRMYLLKTESFMDSNNDINNVINKANNNVNNANNDNKVNSANNANNASNTNNKRTEMIKKILNKNKLSLPPLKHPDKRDHSSGKPKFTIVLFWAPWCPHCTSFKPEWHKLGKHIKLDNGNVCEVKDENCVVNRNAPQKYGIKVDGFPHMSLFKDGKEIDTYEGPRQSSSILSWTKSKCK